MADTNSNEVINLTSFNGGNYPKTIGEIDTWPIDDEQVLVDMVNLTKDFSAVFKVDYSYTTLTSRLKSKGWIDGWLQSNLRNLEYVGQDYMYYNAINSICGYFKNGRVKSWAEAVNIYEDEMHKQRMEDLSRYQAEKTVNMNRQLGQIATTQAVIAANTAIINSKLRFK